MQTGEGDRFPLHTYMQLAFGPGVYAGVMSSKKWLGSRASESWDEFVEVCPNDAKKCDKVPNWARQSLGLKTTLGRVPAAFPIELQHKTDEILLQKMQYGMEVSPPGIADLIGDLLSEYNLQVREVNEEIEKINDSGGHAAPVPLATCKMTRGNLVKLSQRFARRFSWGMYKNEKPGRHLEFNDPHLVSIRHFISSNVKSGRVHPRLVGNWDQVWTLCFEPLKKVVFKHATKQGERMLVGKHRSKANFLDGLRQKAGLPPLNLDYITALSIP